IGNGAAVGIGCVTVPNTRDGTTTGWCDGVDRRRRRAGSCPCYRPQHAGSSVRPVGTRPVGSRSRSRGAFGGSARCRISSGPPRIERLAIGSDPLRVTPYPIVTIGALVHDTNQLRNMNTRRIWLLTLILVQVLATFGARQPTEQ